MVLKPPFTARTYSPARLTRSPATAMIRENSHINSVHRVNTDFLKYKKDLSAVFPSIVFSF